MVIENNVLREICSHDFLFIIQKKSMMSSLVCNNSANLIGYNKQLLTLLEIARISSSKSTLFNIPCALKMHSFSSIITSEIRLSLWAPNSIIAQRRQYKRLHKKNDLFNSVSLVVNHRVSMLHVTYLLDTPRYTFVKLKLNRPHNKFRSLNHASFTSQ